jgi:hypothetical protein
MSNAHPVQEWFGLRELSCYSGLSNRTLRSWIRLIDDPLPAVCIRRKILVRRSEFNAWMERHRFNSLTNTQISNIIDDVLESVTYGR